MTLNAPPAVLLAGALTVKWLAAAGVTVICVSLPLVVPYEAVIDCVPAVFSVALKVCAPASPLVKV